MHVESPVQHQAVQGDAYLHLLKGVLTRTLMPDRFRPISAASLKARGNPAWIPVGMVQAALAKLHLCLCVTRWDDEVRRQGRDWPSEAETMIGMERLNNVEYCVREVLRNNVPGDLMETGVWRGGSCILMRAILRTFGDESRSVWLADSFQGLPKPDGRYSEDSGSKWYKFKDQLGVSIDEVKRNFERYGLLDDRVQFLPGWFCDTLPTAPVERLSVLRLDGDMYSSTMDALLNLYPKLSVGGYLLVDDYGDLGECRQAVTDFRTRYGVDEPIIKVDWTGVYWQKLKP